MNNRIRELAEQVGFGWDDKYHWYVGSRQMEKFAELIVKECVGVVNKRYMGDNNREDMEVRRCVEDLKKHFGVEE
jgi:hypothetical protein